MPERDWKEYPINKPSESGYYYVHYWNPERDDCFYKAISYYKDNWVAWRKSVEGLIVYRFDALSRKDYYTQVI